MVDYVKAFNFDYTAYQENILVVGMIGSGKTTLIKNLLSRMLNFRKWIYDVQGNYHDFGKIVLKLEDLSLEGNYVVDSFDKSKKNFDLYCDIIIRYSQNWKLYNMINVVDEVQLYTNPRDSDSNLMHIVTSLRNRGISNIFITPSPALLPPWIKENTTHVFAMRTNDFNHIEYMEKNFFGSEAWLLTSPDKRKLLKDEPNLGKYSQIYRNINHDFTQVINTNL